MVAFYLSQYDLYVYKINTKFMSSLANNYNRRKISFKYGKGSFLYSTSGKRYLDMVGGIAVLSLGHANPYLIKALTKQAKKVWHISNAFLAPEGEKLAKKITKNSFADKVMYVNSGAEATEASIKVARRYFFSKGKSYKNRIICIKNSFHGRTIAAIHASGSKKMVEGFGPKVPGFDHIDFKNFKPRFPNIRKKIKKNTAAIMIETVMGEGGVKVVPNKCLKYLRKICNEKKILLILDEVQCGIGRTGKFFAFEHANVRPDIVPIAKGIGGGFPIGAVLMTNKVAKCMTPGTHGSTFGGNPLAMSVSNAVLDQLLKKNFFKNVTKLSQYFLKELNKIKDEFPKIIKEIRGKGFLIGIQLHFDQSNFIKSLEQNYLLTIRASENVIRVLPPLNVKKIEIDLALKTIKKVCKEYK